MAEIQQQEQDGEFLIGRPTTEISTLGPPILQRLLRNMNFEVHENNKSIRKSAEIVYKKYEPVWEKFNIVTKNSDKIIAKLENEYNMWRYIVKNKASTTEEQVDIRKEFSVRLYSKFDVKKEEASKKISKEEEKMVPEMMDISDDQPGASTSGATVTSMRRSKVEAIEKLKEHSEHKRPRIDTESGEEISWSSSSSLSASQLSHDSSPYQSDSEEKKPKEPMIKFINANLVTILDGLSLTDRQSVRVICAVVLALGYDLSKLVISRTTIRRIRSDNREKTASLIKGSFEAKFATVHWDGKLMKDITGHKTVDRLPILISQESGVQLLKVPKITNCQGATIAEEIFRTLNEWNAVENIVAMSFDTTAANTGRHIGACAILEHKFGRDLLKLACRHHVYELMLKEAFTTKFGATSKPTVAPFDRFRDNWDNMDKSKFSPGISDPFINSKLADVKDDITEFCKNELKNSFERGDYKELLELTLIFLGEYPETVKFRRPGSASTVRFMARALYVLKMQMFIGEFRNYSTADITAIRDISIFVVRLYTKAFIPCNDPLGAPKQDLNFLKEIQKYANIDGNISSLVLKKFGTHLWYLHPETVALAFFDEKVSVEEKRLMILKLNLYAPDDIAEESTSPYRLIIHPQQMERLQEWQLDHFINENTIRFFQRFNINTEFLSKDPSVWYSDENYCKARDMLQKLQVVNDHAERGVKLMKDFNFSLTKDEQEKQYLLEVVANYRKKRGPLSKSGLSRDTSAVQI